MSGGNMKEMDLPTHGVDLLTVGLRAYVQPSTEVRAAGRRRGRRNLAGPSEWLLCFDTETTTDPSQRLRFGTYQVRRIGEPYEQGIFHDPDALTEAEWDLIWSYAAKHGLKLLTLAEFVEQVFFGIGYDLRATIIGFNLSFDISRLANRWSSARKRMREGFTFQLSGNKERPRVRVKYISRRLAFIGFAAIARQRTWRSERRRGERIPPRRGFFIDVKTIAAALLSRPSLTLKSLAGLLKTPNQKKTSEEHGGPISDEYLDYAVQDVQVTWECYRELASRYQQWGLKRPLHKIYSEASLGKAIMAEMRIRPWRDVQPDFPHELLGWIWSTYFGGRAEVNIRRVVTRVRHCDFLSMYATICTLMKLWEFMRADGIEWVDATEEVADFLGKAELDGLNRKTIWPDLCAIVQVIPDDEVYPVRAQYSLDPANTIGSNHISKGPALWFALAECVGAKLHVGRAPKVVRAIRFKPKAIQQGLRPIVIAGNPAYRIDPRRDDLFKRLIELRHEVKMERDAATGADWHRLNAEQNQLKVLASATSYGCYAEVNVDGLAEQIDAMGFGSSGEAYQTSTSRLEKPGAYYHPLMATLITAGARLMLTIAERLAEREGLDWVFCDTDSMALAKPDGMSDADFNAQADRVQEWFVPLNPYSFGGPLLQTEKYNYRLHNGKPTQELQPVYCFAISSKRYALFNIGDDGRPILRKASAHGLGHWLEPPGYKSPRGIPAPATDLAEIGVRRWEYDLWYRIVLAALEGHPDQVNLSGFHGFNQPAVSRYSVTTPEYLRLFNRYNQSRAGHDQVRPFNFLLAFQAKMGTPSSSGPIVGEGSGRSKAARVPRPIAAYSNDAAENVFDRDTRQHIEKEQLKTYAEVLAKYHLHPESKFLNGEWTERGKLLRRHIEVVGVINIGKEANDLEDRYYLGTDPGALPEYGMAPDGRTGVLARISEAAGRFGRRQLAEGAGISLRTLLSILGRKCRPTGGVIARLLTWVSEQKDVGDEENRAAAEILALARAEAQRIGLRQLAREMGVDAANLAKVLAGQRKPYQRLFIRFRELLAPSL